jgi:hypothetical protein
MFYFSLYLLFEIFLTQTDSFRLQMHAATHVGLHVVSVTVVQFCPKLEHVNTYDKTSHYRSLWQSILQFLSYYMQTDGWRHTVKLIGAFLQLFIVKGTNMLGKIKCFLSCLLSKWRYKGYSESNLQWAVKKTSNEEEKMLYRKNKYILKLLLNNSHHLNWGTCIWE